MQKAVPGFKMGDAPALLTEDLADGQTYCGVRAVNPFK